MNFSVAQDSEVYVATSDFKVNASCGSCKAKVENVLQETDGVQSAVLDLSSFIVSVSYDESKITENDIITKISEAGYTAEKVDSENTTLKAKECSEKATKSDCCSKTTKTKCKSTKKCSDTEK